MRGKILVVDDKALIRKGLYSWLSNRDYGCRSESGIGGLSRIVEMVDEYKPDLVLLDTNLPNTGTTGLAICEELRKTEYGKNIGIIGMSQGSYEEEWFRAGADKFLPKEDIFHRNILEDSIAEVLEKYQRLERGKSEG